MGEGRYRVKSALGPVEASRGTWQLTAKPEAKTNLSKPSCVILNAYGHLNCPATGLAGAQENTHRGITASICHLPNQGN